MFINCKRADACEEHAHGVCPASLAGESIPDLVFFPYACPAREPFEPQQLMKVRQELLDTMDKNSAMRRRVEELRRVRQRGVLKGAGARSRGGC